MHWHWAVLLNFFSFFFEDRVLVNLKMTFNLVCRPARLDPPAWVSWVTGRVEAGKLRRQFITMGLCFISVMKRKKALRSPALLSASTTHMHYPQTTHWAISNPLTPKPALGFTYALLWTIVYVFLPQVKVNFRQVLFKPIPQPGCLAVKTRMVVSA